MERQMNVEPNSMQCDTPEALRFLASAAKAAEAHWMKAAADEIERLRLTDAEREAIERLAIHCADTSCVDTAKTLWGLLQRIDAT
jgi:hypothetical protein